MRPVPVREGGQSRSTWRRGAVVRGPRQPALSNYKDSSYVFVQPFPTTVRGSLPSRMLGGVRHPVRRLRRLRLRVPAVARGLGRRLRLPPPPPVPRGAPLPTPPRARHEAAPR